MNPDPVLGTIQKVAPRFPKIEKVALFGSRARGDHRETSDYDIVVDGKDLGHGEFSKFSTLLEEEAETLHQLDIVFYKEASPELKKSIDREQKVIWQRKTE